MKKRNVVGLLFAASLLALACGHHPVDASSGADESEQTGTLRAALGNNGPTHDVASIEYRVVHSNQTCSDTPLAVRSVLLQSQPLPPSELPDGGGPLHPFADVFFTLPPGQYLVCAQPFQARGGFSNECARATTLATVMPGMTTEIVLVSQCTGQENGGLDTVTILNDPPIINSLNFIPSKFITACQQANLLLNATDPNGDALTIVWTVTTPTGNTQTVTGPSLIVFNPGGTTGDFDFVVTVTDPFGGTTSLRFTMHVLPCVTDGGAADG
jgi:hypothetical protein